MRKKYLVAGATSLFLLSPLQSAFAYDEGEVSGRSRQTTSVAEEKAAIAKEEADVARDFQALEERKALLEERKATLAKRERNVTKDIQTSASEVEQELAELHAKETERGLVLTLGDVLFESGQAKLTADAMRQLYPLVTLLKEHPRREIFIEGYTDSSGAGSYNLPLSQDRAEAVRDFLVSTGIKPERITARGYGEANPVASNTNETGRRENRRVEIVVTREGKKVAEKGQ
jgi:outer membrane protein OmpA-like peptidoglycan-associated protein